MEATSPGVESCPLGAWWPWAAGKVFFEGFDRVASHMAGSLSGDVYAVPVPSLVPLVLLTYQPWLLRLFP